MCYALPRAGNGVRVLRSCANFFFFAKNQVLIPETLTLSWFFQTCFLFSIYRAIVFMNI